MNTLRGRIGISIVSLNSALEGGGSSTPRPGRFTRCKETRNPLYRKIGGSPESVYNARENLSPTGIRFPDRPAHSEFYTDYIIPFHTKIRHMVTITPLSLLILPVNLAGYSTSYLPEKQ
jgi:hypothetical protein